MLSGPIKFLDTATNQTATEYQNLTVRCEVDGDPMPTVTWTVNGKEAKGRPSVSFISIKKPI